MICCDRISAAVTRCVTVMKPWLWLGTIHILEGDEFIPWGKWSACACASSTQTAAPAPSVTATSVVALYNESQMNRSRGECQQNKHISCLCSVRWWLADGPSDYLRPGSPIVKLNSDLTGAKLTRESLQSASSIQLPFFNLNQYCLIFNYFNSA